MRKTDRLAWRLSFLVIAIVVVAVVAYGLIATRISREYALGSARDVLEFNSESIRSGIERLMMSRNNAAVKMLLEDLSRGSSVYRHVGLVSHPAGEVVVSSRERSSPRLERSERTCRACHATEPPTLRAGSVAFQAAAPDGAQFLHVVTPILNKPSCRTADCHVHAGNRQVLGLLHAKYSLGSVHELIASLSYSIVLPTALAVLVLVPLLWLLFRQLLGLPLRGVVAGLQALTADDLTFRFRTTRRDEIGMLEGAFDRMADRIQAQRTEIKDAYEYLESIVEHSVDIIITVSPDGLIQTFNRGAEQALGYARAELLGRHIETLFADPRERDAAIARLALRDNVVNYETRFVTKRGEVRHVLLTLSRLRDRDGNAIGTLGISKDVTTEKDLQQQLVRSENAAAIGRAVTGIQHAIKNMLNVLQGGLYLVRLGVKKDKPTRIDEGCEMLEEGLKRITRLSQGMLKQAREWTIDPEPTDVGRLVETIVTELGPAAHNQRVELVAESAPELPTVQCDPGLVHMVLMDMATNALEACGEKEYETTETRTVVLRVTNGPDREYIAIEVQDNGVGMSAEILQGIFTPFFSTKKKLGTGLGLSLAARIVALHGGRVSAKSTPGEGSTFQIVLPLGGPQANQE
jgi:PAS domain S-box-containing protein